MAVAFPSNKNSRNGRRKAEPYGGGGEVTPTAGKVGFALSGLYTSHDLICKYTDIDGVTQNKVFTVSGGEGDGWAWLQENPLDVKGGTEFTFLIVNDTDSDNLVLRFDSISGDIVGQGVTVGVKFTTPDQDGFLGKFVLSSNQGGSDWHDTYFKPAEGFAEMPKSDFAFTTE